MNTANLIQQVRNILIYDLDLPQDTPGTEIADAEVLSMLNVAQDEMARVLELYSPSIAFSFASGSEFAYDDAGFSKRIHVPHKLFLSTGEEVRQILPSEHNPAIDVVGGKYWFWLDESLNFYPVQTSAFSGYVQGLYLPAVMEDGDSCGLPYEISARQLARYTVGSNANVFATENHQVMRCSNMVGEAIEACNQYRKRIKGKRVKADNRRASYYV